MTRRSRPAPPTSASAEARAFWENLPDYDQPDFPAPDDREGWRRFIAGFDAMAAATYAGREHGLSIEEREAAGVTTYVLHGDEVDPAGPAYLEIHGGGLFLYGGDLVRLTAADIASVNGMVTWSPDYRMIPDHPYPAALDDVLAVYRAMLDVHDPSQLFVGGTSAGGNLAAALVVRAIDEGLPLPAALVLLTPELDLTESGDSFATLEGIDVLTSMQGANQMYAAGEDLAHPYLSPLFADVTRFPPTLLQAGTRDLFLSNAARMHAKLCAAGVETELHIGEAMPHGGFGGSTPEDRHLRQMVRRFLDRHRQPSR